MCHGDLRAGYLMHLFLQISVWCLSQASAAGVERLVPALGSLLHRDIFIEDFIGLRKDTDINKHLSFLSIHHPRGCSLWEGGKMGNPQRTETSHSQTKLVPCLQLLAVSPMYICVYKCKITYAV